MNPLSSSSEPTNRTQTNLPKPKRIHITKVEVIGDTATFFDAKGFAKNRLVTVKEIPINEITSIENVGNELSITWAGVTYTFLVKKNVESLSKLRDQVKARLEERRRSLENDKSLLKKMELSGIINASIRLIDLSFDILFELHETQIDWRCFEDSYNAFRENSPTAQTLSPLNLNLNFSKVSSAIKKRSPSETSKETYEILKTTYSYFSDLKPREGSKESLQDFATATELVLAYLRLNELLLAKVVGDKENLEENIYLESVLQTLSVEANFKVNVGALRDSIDKIDIESDKKSVIEQARSLFKEQLKQVTGFEGSSSEGRAARILY